MYIWCAIELERQLGEMREAVEKITCRLGTDNPALTLPLHISLKISCEIGNESFDEAVLKISRHFSTIRPFKIFTENIERCGGVVWIRHSESEELRSLHEWLVDLFKTKYSVKPHEFDLDFAYHSSLFVGEEKNAEAAYKMLKDISLPEILIADSFVIGCSESGKAGEYRVVKIQSFQS